MPGTPGCGELSEGAVAERAVWSALVVVSAPCADDLADLGERAEPVLVQALVAGLAVEALRVHVLCRLAGLYQAQRHSVAVGTAIERVADELGVLIGAQYPR